MGLASAVQLVQQGSMFLEPWIRRLRSLLSGDGASVDELRLSNNTLNGQLPWELVLLNNLKILDFDSNWLVGSIPSELGTLSYLEFLRFDLNWMMNGTIPSELSQLLSLTSLDINNNQFTGTIPTEFGRLRSLTYLDMSYNLLTGPIPTELGQLTSLESLHISNELTGTIPTELGQRFIVPMCIEERKHSRSHWLIQG